VGVEAAINYSDLRRMARKRLPRIAFDFIEGGVDSEECLARNAKAFANFSLVPKRMVNVDAVDGATRLFGQTYGQPFGIAPTGAAGLLHAGADLMLAHAARVANIPFIMSGASTATMEELAEITPDLGWYQLYMPRDRAIGDDMIRRADRCGFPVLVLTVDVPGLARNERDIRNGLSPPMRPSLSARAEALLHPRWIYGYLTGRGFASNNWQKYIPSGAGQSELLKFLIAQLPVSVTWDDVAHVRELWPRRFVLKGVMHPADAKRAAAFGVDGVIVSNHGGRQLDRAPAAIEALAPICDAVGDKMTIMLDSGIRCGADIVTALCLGAKFVFVGRWTLYGVAAGGQPGAHHAVAMIRSEVMTVMRQIGATNPDTFGPSFLMQRSRSP
jgi:isopentenyl diphosphate isomerase/L-lactate dehydrogenase-like FMN-dependent dehydrogenase